MRAESNFCSKLLFETSDSVDSLQLTTTCCNGRWRPSERRARGAQTERVRAATSATERVRAVRPDARAELLSEHDSVAASRGVLFVAPGGRAPCARPIVPRCASRDCWPVRHLAPVYARSDSRATLRPSNCRAHSLHVLRPTATGKPRAPRNRSIDSACEARRATRRSCASRVRQWRNFVTRSGRSPGTSLVCQV